MSAELNASSGTFHDKKQILVNDLKDVVGDANDILKQVAHSTVEEFGVARSKIQAKLGDARTAVTEKAKCAAGATDEYVKVHPWKTLGIAAVAGLVVGFLLQRR